MGGPIEDAIEDALNDDDGDGGGGGGGGGSPSSASPTTSGGGGAVTEAKTPAQVLAERRAQRAFAELRRTYLETLRRWGLRPSKNLLNLIERGVRGAWSTTQFMAMVRHTADYRQKFPGIQWKQGMTEGTYMSTYAQYKARAQDAGIKLTAKEFGRALKRGIDMEEFSERVDALATYKSYAPMWEQFKVVLGERGIQVPGGSLGKKEMVKFILGRGSKQWEQIYQETFLSVNLQKVAGISIVEPGRNESPTADTLEINRQELLQIIKQVEGVSGGKFEVESLTPQYFAELGARLRKFNMSYLKRYGLTTKDLLEMELGGPRAAEIRTKAERVLATQEAFYEPRAIQRTPALEQQQPEEEVVQSR